MSQNEKDEIIDASFVSGIDLDLGNLTMSDDIPFPEFLFQLHILQRGSMLEKCVSGGTWYKRKQCY